MKTPFFSVIIPTLNEEKYLPTILKSLSVQTFRQFELLVVDANSKDGTQKVYEQYKKHFPSARLFQSEKRHVSAQRNLGARMAKGQYLIFFDADVDMGPTFLEEIHIAALKQKFVFATTWVVPDSQESVDEMMILMSNLGIELINSLQKPTMWGFNIMIKRDVFYKLKGFREDTKISEDHDLAIRAVKKNYKLTILREPQLIMSLRRFRAQGVLQVLRQYAQATVHMFLKGPITSEFFNYPMGGHVYRKRRKKIDLTKLRTYTRGIEKLERKLIRLLE